MKDNRILRWCAVGLGLIAVIWVSVLLAPTIGGGLPSMLPKLGEAFSHPMRLSWCERTPTCMLILTAIYGFSLLIYHYTKPNYRRRVEHGSAEWGEAQKISKKYSQSPREMNKILTQNVEIGYDAHKHRRNLNTLVVGGSGAGKTRFYAKPNIMQGSVIASDMNVSSGAYFSFGLSKDGEALNADNVMLNDGKLYYVVREKDENGKVTSTAYYQLDLKEKSSEIIGGEDKKEDQPLPVYESATVTKTGATTVYTADAGYYVDILPGNKVLLMAQRASKDVDGKPAYNSILIAECTYDAETGVYTLKATNDYTYTVKVSDGVATVTAEANAKEEA